MIRRVKNISLIDPASLPSPLNPGAARLQFEVEFWDVATAEAAVGPPDAEELFTTDFYTRTAIFRNDQWELTSEDEEIVREIDRRVSHHEARIWQGIQDGVRGRLWRGERREDHGLPKEAPIVDSQLVKDLEAVKASPLAVVFQMAREERRGSPAKEGK